MTTTKTLPQQTDSTTISPENKKFLWVLHYRKGNNPHPMTKQFFCEGELRSVVERAKKHCETVGERFVRVEPFITDLAQLERQHLGQAEPQNAD